MYKEEDFDSPFYITRTDLDEAPGINQDYYLALISSLSLTIK